MTAAQPDSGTIPARYRPWVRLAWFLAAGLSLWTFGGTLFLTRQLADHLPLRLLDALAAVGWTPDDWLWVTVGTILPVFLPFFALGAAIYWLRPADRIAAFTSLFLVTFAGANSFSPAREYLSVLADAPPWIFVPNALTGMIAFGMLPVFFATFPDGIIYPGWMRWIIGVFFVYVIGWNLFPDVVGDFSGPLGALSLAVALLNFIGGVAAQVLRYRKHSTPMQRQQTKWVLFCLVFVVLGVTVPAFFVYSIPPESIDAPTGLVYDMVVAFGNLAFVLLPVSMAISILQYRLWDIDLIIRRTLQYALLTGLLALAYFGGVVLLQGLIDPLYGTSNSPLVTVLTTLAIAALFNPLRTRVQAFIDRRLFRQKYNAEQSLARFAAAARSEVDLDRLAAALLGVVEETVQPERADIRLKS